MKSNLKAGILIILLIIPALVFLFLKYFGTNHYTLRTYYPLGIAETGKSKGDTIYHQIPSFSFISQTGRVVTEKDFEGAIFVADFFFTKCAGICPTMSSSLARVHDSYLDNSQIKLISHTVDPNHDSIAALDVYAKKYNANPEKWFLVTGEKKEIYDIARNGYFISALEGDGGTEDFIHSEKLILVDKSRRIRGYYDGTDSEDVDRLLLEIKILLHEYKNSK